jgi:CubicO group peptidase (beta-lactamase class C family)
VNINDRKDYKFGFGVSVLGEKGSRGYPSQPGTYAWGGLFSTTFWVDPKEHLLVIFLQQMWGPHIAETQKLFRTLVYQAIVK